MLRSMAACLVSLITIRSQEHLSRDRGREAAWTLVVFFDLGERAVECEPSCSNCLLRIDLYMELFSG